MLSMDKNRQLLDDHDRLLQRKYLLFNQQQQRNRNKILKRSRQQFDSMSQQQKLIQDNEEQELEDRIDAMEIEGCKTKLIESNLRTNQEDNLEQYQINDNFINLNEENYTNEIFQNEQNAQPKLSKKQQRKIEKDRLRSEVNLKLTQQIQKDSHCLMVQPQYMIEIPDDIDSYYFVIPKPSGKRCLVITKNQITTSLEKNGGIQIQNFQNFLPNGTQINEKQKFYSILDCIYNEEQQTYYIMDIIIDKDLNTFENSTDMRFFWIQQNFSKDKFQDISGSDHFKFKFIPKFTCNRGGFEKPYQFKFDFMKEGVLFIHKEGNQNGGIHHNFITWMDSNSTNNYLNKRVPLAIKQQQDASPKIITYLQCDENYCLSTLDNYILYQLDPEERKIYQIKPYMIVKTDIDSIQLTQLQVQLLEEFDQFPQELEKTNKNSNSIEEEIKLRKNWVFVEGLNILEVIDSNQIYETYQTLEDQSEYIVEDFEQKQYIPDSLVKLVNEYKLRTNSNCYEQVYDKIELEIENNESNTM